MLCTLVWRPALCGNLTAQPHFRRAPSQNKFRLPPLRTRQGCIKLGHFVFHFVHHFVRFRPLLDRVEDKVKDKVGPNAIDASLPTRHASGQLPSVVNVTSSTGNKAVRLDAVG
jgi:hypothetical protein